MFGFRFKVYVKCGSICVWMCLRLMNLFIIKLNETGVYVFILNIYEHFNMGVCKIILTWVCVRWVVGSVYDN